MKNSIFLLLLTITCTAYSIQDETINAYSKSYQFESYKQYNKAIKSLEPVYEITSYSINLRLGWLHYLNGEFTQSLKYYKQAIVLEPKSVEALLGITYPQAAMLNWNDLTKTYLSILKIDKMNKDVNYRLGQIYYNKKDYQKAESHLLTIIKTYPFDYNANVLLAQTKTKKGEIKAAKKHYNIALLYSPDNIQILKALIQLQ